MRTQIWPLYFILFFAAAVPAQEPPRAATPELTKQEKKAIAEAEKQRKKFPDWIAVSRVGRETLPTQTIGYVGWCGGNLNWIFCASTPITSGGGERVLHRIRLESSNEERIVTCALHGGWNLPRPMMISPGRYPAKKGRLGIYVLANVEGKMKRLLCYKP